MPIFPMNSHPYQLLGADVSYYTAKIRAYLIHKRLPFTDVLATRTVFRDEILPRVGWPVIPVLITPENTTLQDTSEMIDALEARHLSPTLLPQTPVARFAALLFELYADEWIKVPALHYRWHYDREFAITEFGRNNDPERSLEAQYHIGEKIAAPFATWPSLLGVSPTTQPAIEASYLALLAALEAHFLVHPFLFGAMPTLADCALYGPFHAHLYRDPNSGRIMRAVAPGVVAWVQRMQIPVPHSDHAFIEQIPDSLLPAWRLMSRDYIPILCAQTDAFQDWLAEHPKAAIPRTFGTHAVIFGRDLPQPAAGTRALFSYDQWMLQRALAVCAAATPTERRLIAEFATTIGADALLDLKIPQPIRRENFKLVRA